MGERPRILVVDDDARIAAAVRRALVYDGYDVETADDGPGELDAIRARPPDLVVLDVMLPTLDGIEVCRRIRGDGDVPVLMLTARDAVVDRVNGLDSGADDYLVKPFAHEELLARVRSLLRRRAPRATTTLRLADLTMDLGARQVWRGDRPLALTALEFQLLEHFLVNARLVLSRAQLLEAVWGLEAETSSNVVDVYVGYLRQKLEAGGEPRLLQTVRGFGYVLRETAAGPEVRLHLRRWERSDGDLRGIVVAGQSTAFADQQLAGSRVFLAVAGVLALFAAAIAAYVAAGRALRPLRLLAATADEIGRTGDLSRRLPPVRSRDAVGRLTSSFNAMLGRLGAAQHQLSQTVEAQRRFLADASHELRSPLTSIRSNAAFLVQHPEAEAADRDEALADIAAESDRMSRLVDGLLTLARADAEPPRAARGVDLSQALDAVVQRYRRLGWPVTMRGTRSATVTGDEDALTQVAAILLDNATVHGSGQVEVDVWSSDRTVTMAVSDQGPGLGRADLDRAFERFYRANGAGDTGSERGAGLGLAIARSIVEAHGGSIRAASRDGGGAVFVVDLPRAR